jgi:hypothetical protein
LILWLILKLRPPNQEGYTRGPMISLIAEFHGGNNSGNTTRHPKTNPLGLCPAHQLYENKTYSSLVSRFGSKNVYILSAGWGLIGSDFLTPYYDITFSQSADAYKRRRKTDRFEDFRMLPDETTGEIIFLGGKDYLPLFCKLTDRVKAKRIVFFNSASPPRFENCIFKRFETTTRTNWHYECANEFLAGRVRL